MILFTLVARANIGMLQLLNISKMMFLADCCKLPQKANSSKLDASDELDLFTFAIEAGGQRWVEITVTVPLLTICTFLYTVIARKDSITSLFGNKVALLFL